jgi:ABC-type transport system involved in multi-copper enzyme maturation permease subunit
MAVAIFRTFWRLGLAAKRFRLFAVFSLIPTLVLLIVKIVELTNPDFGASALDVFVQSMMVFYFQLLIPILAIFYGSSSINDEIDGKTLVYLTTSEAPKPVILLAKFAAHYLHCVLLIAVPLLLSFAVAHVGTPGAGRAWLDFPGYLGVALLALLAYSSCLALLGAFMRKSIILGLFFAFGWEGVVQYFPGSTQKFTIIHYVKSLLPIQPANGGFLIFQLEPSSIVASVVTLLAVSALALGAAVFIFERKEYIVSDSV